MAMKPKLDADLSGNLVDQADYRSKIGSLMYLTSSRADIVQAVCFCARYQSRPTEKHLKEVKRIFRYLRGTVNMGLWYPKGSSFKLTAFSDADHVGYIDSRKSTFGGIQFIGDKLVSWMSKKQNCTAMSSVEAEYVALSTSCAQVMWMRTQLQDYGFIYNKIPLYSDSQTEYQLADMFTKALSEDRFKYLVRRIVRNPDFKERKVFLQRKRILSMRISTILGLELFLQDIQRFELKKRQCTHKVSNKFTRYKKGILEYPNNSFFGSQEYYEDILPIIMDKVRRDRRKDVHTMLDFREGPRERTREDFHHSSARVRTTKPKRLKVQDRLRYDDRHVLDRLGHQRHNAFERLSKTYSPSTTKSRPQGADSKDYPRGRSRPHRLDTSKEDHPKDKDCFCSIEESYDDSFSHSYRDGNRSLHMKGRRDYESPLSSVSRSDSSDRRYRRSRSKRRNSTDGDDLTKPWMSEEEDPFTPRIRAARVWFDELPSESIDSYKDFKAAFLAYFMQQKKYVKDPMEIHNIKQKDGETIEDFMKRFKVKTGRTKGAPECMRISRFMHGVNNPELIKCLNENVPKTMEEMMITTTAFIRGEAAAACKKKGLASWKAHDQTPKEILAVEAGKFQPPPPMVTPVEKRSSNKFCDFYNDKEHNTDECMQLKKQIKELVRACKLSHLIKEIKNGRDHSPSSTTIDQDAPSPSKSQTIPETQPHVIPNNVEEDNHDIEVAHMGNDLLFGMPIPEVAFDQSSSTDSIHTVVHPDHQISQHNSKWT
nr:copia protein [Tanacetum cinerariifolium]